MNKLANTGVKALEDEFDCQGLLTPLDRVKLVQVLLGDESDITSKKRPFLWQSVYENPDAEQSVMSKFQA